MITMGYSNIPYKNYFFYYANDIHEVCKRELHVLGCYVILHSVKKHPVAVFLYSLYILFIPHLLPVDTCM